MFLLLSYILLDLFLPEFRLFHISLYSRAHIVQVDMIYGCDPLPSDDYDQACSGLVKLQLFKVLLKIVQLADYITVEDGLQIRIS